MTIFFRLLHDADKESVVNNLSILYRSGSTHENIFEVSPDSFEPIPGKPFAYWVSNAIRETFLKYPPFEGCGRTVRQGMATADDFRFVRAWWETKYSPLKWFPFAKGGSRSPFYSEIPAVVNWGGDGREIRNFYDPMSGKLCSRPQNIDFFFMQGLTWPLRGVKFSAQAVPSGCIFSIAGKMAFSAEGEIKKWLGIFNSKAFDYLIALFAGKVGGVQYEAGLIGTIPAVDLSASSCECLDNMSSKAWSIKRKTLSTEETSRTFSAPFAVYAGDKIINIKSLEDELIKIQAEIDNIAFDLYGFSPADRVAALGAGQTVAIESDEDAPGGEEDEADEAAAPVDDQDALRSWAIGVAFGRFDWRLATGEREAPPEPEPFDPLPAKSPGMLPDGAAPFHTHPGILADDPGHPHDLTRLTERVLERVGQPVPPDLRRWLQREFFPFHLQRYSKSRRKAPLYWPLATPSGSYTLWLYYPDLSSQTLYTAVNDFLDGPTGKLAQVTAELTHLRAAGSARSRDDERRLETLTTLDAELRDLRDTLLQIAPTYQPNHDDGVQITAAPLWPLFRHKPWQKLLKETWTKLEKGDYDWAHLAMAYWPQRVREKCKTDKSLAIAHGLEDLYIEPEAAPKKTRGRKKKTST